MKNIDARLAKAFLFYRAAREPKNLNRLAAAGFQHKDLEEGGALLIQALARRGRRRFPTHVDSTLLGRFDAYQSRWFPTARATLERHDPDLAKLFFSEMVQLDEGKSPISVYEFLATLEKLGKGEAPFGKKGPEARALLATRMLTAEVEAEGNALLEEWNRPADGIAEEPVSKSELDAAILAAWKWRCEWADHARTVISERNVLREFGVGRKVKKAAPKEEAGDSVAPALPLAPAAPALPTTNPTTATTPATVVMNGTHS